MATHRRLTGPSDAIQRSEEPLHALQSPEITKGLELLRGRYARRLTPIEEVRAMLDGALGDRSLTEELYRMRGCAE